MKPVLPRDGFGGALAIVAGVGIISVLHYVTSVHSLVLHEIFKQLYYIPIVIAAVTYGVKAGLATSAFASLLYVPHIVMSWHAWPALEMDQYGDVLLFNLVAAITGVLADRLRTERNRYRQASVELQAANGELLARADERIQADRLVTMGRLASGIAHEVRNPLGALLGCLEILEEAPRLTVNQHEFFALARKEIDRVNRVVDDFLEFTRPPSATPSSNDLVALARSAVRLAQPNLALRGVEVQVTAPVGPIPVRVDPEQLRRAIVNLLLDQFAPARKGAMHVSIVVDGRAARASVEVPGITEVRRVVTEVFEPFPEHGNGHGLSLAIARRLIENQRGTVNAEVDGATLRYVIELPLDRWVEEAAAGCSDFHGRPVARPA